MFLDWSLTEMYCSNTLVRCLDSDKWHGHGSMVLDDMLQQWCMTYRKVSNKFHAEILNLHSESYPWQCTVLYHKNGSCISRAFWSLYEPLLMESVRSSYVLGFRLKKDVWKQKTKRAGGKMERKRVLGLPGERCPSQSPCQSLPKL